MNALFVQPSEYHNSEYGETDADPTILAKSYRNINLDAKYAQFENKYSGIEFLEMLLNSFNLDFIFTKKIFKSTKEFGAVLEKYALQIEKPHLEELIKETEDLEKVAEIDKEFARVEKIRIYYFAAFVYYEKGEYEECGKFLQMVLHEDPENLIALVHFGLLDLKGQ